MKRLFNPYIYTNITLLTRGIKGNFTDYLKSTISPSIATNQVRSLAFLSSSLNNSKAELAFKDKDEFTLDNFYDWFRGFTDAEGCFQITHLRDNFWRFNFEIKLHIDDLKVLYFINNTLGIGKVYESEKSCRFIVSKQSDIKKILDIFTNYPLISSKRLNLSTWGKAFKLYTDENTKVSTFSKIKTLKAEMNTNRTDFTCNLPININSYWLLGFVEGDGSWIVDKKNYGLIFSIAQSSKDLELMKAIKNYLNNLNSEFNDIVSMGVYNEGSLSSMVNLTVTKTDAISQVIIPLFFNMTWFSKKEMDFTDWTYILKIKELGLHHTEEGVRMINRIISQMNNNRLSTTPGPSVDRDLLLLDLKPMLEGGSNYEYKPEGQIVIKSSGKFLKSSSYRRVIIKDEIGNTLNEFESIKSCAAYLGVSHQTVLRRLRDGKSIKWNSSLIFVKPK